jgi:glycosyltransferase involved in cell wall biosynthesis
MRVLMLNYEYPPLGGGASPITGALAEQLAARDHDVDVITMGYRGLPRYEQHGRLRVFRVPAWRRSPVTCSTPEMLTYLAPAAWQALRLDRQQPYDVIHAHFIIPTSPVGVLLRAFRRRPLVVTIHGSDVPGYNPDRFKTGHRALGPVWRWLTRQADAIVSPSAFLRDLLQTHSDAPVTIIPYGFESQLASSAPRQKRLLVASRLFPRKGVQYFIEALHGLALEGWDVVIAGDGPYRAELEALARRLGVSVRFAGFVKGQALADLYASSAIFAFPSVRDNFPVVLLEAMSAGCAVVAADAGGSPEVMGDAGVLVPPADVAALREALRGLIDDAARRERCGTLARRRIEQLRWRVVVPHYEAVYETVRQNSRGTLHVRKSI